MTEMLKVVDKDERTAIVSMFHMLKNVEENMHIRQMKDLKKTNGTPRDEKYNI